MTGIWAIVAGSRCHYFRAVNNYFRFVKTGTAYCWGASKWQNIDSTSSWFTLSLDTQNQDGTPSSCTFDPTTPAQLGIQVSTNGGGEASWCTKDYALSFGAPLTTIAYLDDIEIQPRPLVSIEVSDTLERIP